MFNRSFLLCLLLAPASAILLCGCDTSTPSGAENASSGTTDLNQPSGPSIRELSDEREVVKELLDIDAYAFEFSGTLLAVWLEVETKIEGEENIIRRLGAVSVSQESIENDAPESVRGRFIVFGNVMESPTLRLVYESESKGGGSTLSNPNPPLAPSWPEGGAFGGPSYQWVCPSTLPDEGQEFVIATINKTVNEPKISDGKPDGWNFTRETTVTIKGKRLHGAPDPAPDEEVAVTSLRNARASVYLEGFKGDYQGDSKARAKKVTFPYLREDFAPDTLTYLSELTELEILDLRFTQITDDELVHLKGLSNLEELSLGRKVTPAGLEHLSGLSKLEKLSLPDVQVNDAGLAHLEKLSQLKQLSFKPGGVSDEALAQFKKALPNCEIPRSPASKDAVD